MRNKAELFKRYSFFFFGIIINAIGVALITRSNLGAGPTTCIPYIISRIPFLENLKFPISYGLVNFIFNFLLLLTQIIILRKKFNPIQWLQLPIAFLFSFFLDLAMKLTAKIPLDFYVYSLLWTLLGCVLRAFGVSCQVLADVVMLPPEAFVKAISDVSKKDFSVCKLISDAAMSAIGVAISFIFMHHLVGVREGTLISALIVGPISHYFTKKMALATHFFENEVELVYETKLQIKEGKRLVVTITSESDCNGYEIASELGKRLNIPVYNKELIDMIAKRGNFSYGFVKDHDEKLYMNGIHALLFEHYNFGDRKTESYNGLFEAQKQVVRELAETQDCIIVGHCANYILRDMDEAVSVFLYSNNPEEEHKQKFSDFFNHKRAGKDGLENKDGKYDRLYSEYYRHFTGSDWKCADDYDVSFNSVLFGQEGTVDMIEEIVKKTYIDMPKVKVRRLRNAIKTKNKS